MPADPIDPRLRTERVDTTHHVEERRKGVSPVLIIILVLVVGVVLAFATGLLSLNSSGELRAPDVTVSGGETPDVDLDTGSIDVGTETRTVEVPDVSIERADETN
ncbi:hypothetical protein GCM10007973_06700 [Polymorphobacter multimanifer]|uniref:Uncharacterized protein n=1 Tax=Polymorphobacter multimanifer TaxID=1070431 RepID=A0A841LDW3_9SPHN|nr:hypothetical protein [Polymorphobacter multimanifer]MBB6227168.1 hypothetical protein [Polymorphobacter multimanifer]GGI72341.1 hypothetical protein GCM10007973_06700 [Polymorphobacter multimanifer]